MQQAITWANVDPDLCHQMASLGLNELNKLQWCDYMIEYWVSSYNKGHYEWHALLVC